MITTIIPTYNNAATIIAAIESVIRQTYRDTEIVIVDDGSSDNTQDVISGYIEKGKVHYYKKQNGGCGSARNYGLQHAQGDYIAFLDADDEWLPGHLQQSFDLLISGGFDWVAGAYYKRLPDGNKDYRTLAHSEIVHYDRESCYFSLLNNGIFWFSSVPVVSITLLYKKSVIDQLGGYDEKFIFSEDWDLYLRTEEAGYRGGYIDCPQAIYNHNSNGTTKSKTVEVIFDHIRLARKHAEILGLDKVIIRKSYAEFIWHAGRTFLSINKFSCALKCFIVSMRYDFKISRCIRPLYARLIGQQNAQGS